jgi:hypothetical protein
MPHRGLGVFLCGLMLHGRLEKRCQLQGVFLITAVTV